MALVSHGNQRDNMKQKEIDFYMKTALASSELSYCTKLKVGAVLVKDKQIISYGYNGTPSGDDNVCEEYLAFMGELKTKPNVIHAEMNAIYKATQSTISTKGASLFVTHSPCIQCSLAIIQTGIAEVYYREEYRDSEPIEYLRSKGILVTRIE